MDRVVEKHRRVLPHFQKEGQIISLTWRLAFTLPRNILVMLDGLKETLAEIRTTGTNDKHALYSEYARKLEEMDIWLGQYELNGFSLCEQGFGEIIGEAFRFYSDRLYHLHCFCVMPNHVHLLIRPLPDKSGIYIRTSTIVQRLKGYTAKQINAQLERSGNIWQRSYFDRYIRNPDDYYNVVEYILNNPVAAGLVKKRENWKYSCYRPGLIE